MSVTHTGCHMFRITPTTNGFHIDVNPVALYWLKWLMAVGIAIAVAGLLVLLIVPLIAARRREGLMTCPGCGGVSPPSPACPTCGHVMTIEKVEA